LKILLKEENEFTKKKVLFLPQSVALTIDYPLIELDHHPIASHDVRHLEQLHQQ
jgi:hypothetical protein